MIAPDGCVDRLQRRDLQLPRARATSSRRTGPSGPAPTPRFCSPPMRGGAPICLSASARHVRLRALGSEAARAVRRPRPLRHQAVLLRASSIASSTSPPRSRRCCRSCRRSRPTGRRFAEYLTFQYTIGDADAVRRHPRSCCPGHMPARRGRRGRVAALLGRRTTRSTSSITAEGSTRRLRELRPRLDPACTCAPTCRSAPTFRAASIRASSRMLASRESARPRLGFHGKFTDYPGYDESGYAASWRPMPRRSSCTQLDIGAGDFRDSIADVIYHLDTPVAGPGSFPQFMVSQTRGRACEGRARRAGRRRDLRRLRALSRRLFRAGA